MLTALAQYALAVVNGIVIFGCSSYIGALNASNGSSLWNYTVADVSSSPVVVNGVVFVGAYTPGSVYALNVTNGDSIWNYTTGGGVGSSPAVAYGVVYVGSNDNNVYALRASNGELLWKYSTANTVSFFSSGC